MAYAALGAAELVGRLPGAAELLAGSQNLSTFKRLSACARRVLFLTASVSGGSV